MISAVETWTLRQAVLFQAVLLAVQSALYFGSAFFQKNHHNVMRNADERIPFFPPAVLAYILWFPLIAVFPPVLFCAGRPVYLRYILSVITGVLISTAVYLLWPTAFERPAPPDTLCGRILKAVQKGDFHGANCLPSLHCTQCFTVIFFACVCTEMPLTFRAGTVLLALCITASTVLTKQHTLIDVLAAVPTAAFSILSGFLLAGCL